MFTTETDLKIDYTGRNIEITDALKKHCESKVKKILKYIDDIMEVHVILAIEKHRHIAEVTMKSKSAVFSGQETTDDMYTSIGGVLEKITRQAKKYKEKHWGNKRRAKKTTLQMGVLSPGSVVSDGNGQPRIVKRSKLVVKPMTIEEAVTELDSLKNDFVVFRNADSNQVTVVYKRKDGNLGLIQP